MLLFSKVQEAPHHKESGVTCKLEKIMDNFPREGNLEVVNLGNKWEVLLMSHKCEDLKQFSRTLCGSEDFL